MKQRGFTFIEILVVIGIIGLFIGLSIPQLRSFQQVSHLENINKEVIAALRLAQSHTLASKGALQYGVYFDVVSIPNQYILFEGSNYATRNAPKDEVKVLKKEVEISSILLGGEKEVVFARLTGQANSQGAIIFRLIKDPDRTKVVSILASGAVQEGNAVSRSDDNREVDSRHVEVVYQGRDIALASESIRLIFPDITFSFDIASNMSEGEILWEGDIVSEGVIQHIKIHTLLLNDPLQGTIFSLHRDRDKNTESLQIELAEDITGNLISYDEVYDEVEVITVITQGTSIYAKEPEIQ